MRSKISLGIEARAFDAQLLGGGPQIGDAGEVEANGRAALRRFGLRGRAQILDRLLGLGQHFDQSRAIRAGLDAVEAGPPQRARDEASEQGLQGVEFEQIGAGGLHNISKAFSITGSVPSVMRYCGNDARSTHWTSLTSSAAASEPPVTRQR